MWWACCNQHVEAEAEAESYGNLYPFLFATNCNNNIRGLDREHSQVYLVAGLALPRLKGKSPYLGVRILAASLLLITEGSFPVFSSVKYGEFRLC